MKNMTLPGIARAVNGKLYIIGRDDDLEKKEASSVVIDSRLVQEDGIFVAVKGERTDGHIYIGSVLEKGALGVICERIPEEVTASDKKKGAYILVEDTLKALRDLAAYYRRQISAKIIGIVGSVGKTSTKELVASVLSEHFSTLKTEGNFNNEIGVPLTVFRIRDEHEMAVIEMGISDFGEMDRLGTIVNPDVVIMTNIGPCHLENLKDLNGVLKAKSEVIRHIKQGGLLILNMEDAMLRQLIEACPVCLADGAGEALKSLRVVGYGNGGEACYEDIENLGVEGSCFTLKACTGTDACGFGKSLCAGKEAFKSVRVRVHMQGTHMVMNSLAAALAGLNAGMSLEEIAKGIEAAKPVKGRCCPNHTDRYLVVDDSYNANPKSMMAAVDMMSETAGRRVLIFGDMFELGTEEAQLHRQVGLYAAGKDIDVMVCVGKLSKNMYDAYTENCKSCGSIDSTKQDAGVLPECAGSAGRQAYYFEDRESLLEGLAGIGLKDGDVILVKASHGMGFALIVDKLIEMGRKYTFVKGRENMRIDDIMRLLAQTHWACNRSRETVEKAMENSLCFGMLDEDGRQVAFGRTVTDYATMFYVSDVVLDKTLHKRGLGRRFVEFIKTAPELEYLWGFLGTTKAKGFYEKCGFLPKDDFFMAMPKTNVKGIFNV